MNYEARARADTFEIYKSLSSCNVIKYYESYLMRINFSNILIIERDDKALWFLISLFFEFNEMYRTTLYLYRVA